MIPKANGYFAAAAAVLGFVLTPARPAIAETMLDQVIVSEMGVAEVNENGQCVVIVMVNTGVEGVDELRVVGDLSGAAKLYANLGATASLMKSAKLEPGTDIVFKVKPRIVNLSDPISMLKRVHKAHIAEAAKTLVLLNKLTAEIAAGVALGWSVAPAGSAEKNEDVEMRSQLGSVKETYDNAVSKAQAFATALTNAGINPATYLPIV